MMNLRRKVDNKIYYSVNVFITTCLPYGSGFNQKIQKSWIIFLDKYRESVAIIYSYSFRSKDNKT